MATTCGMKCKVTTRAAGIKQVARPARVVQCRASAQDFVGKVKEAGKVAAAIGASVLVAGSAQNAMAMSFQERQALTYLQVKGTGIANTCPVLDGSSDLKSLKGGDYTLSKFCLEPTSFAVKEEGVKKNGEADFVATKLMTRLTYTLDEISGKMKIGGDGSVELKEEDGIDYAATTVQLPGGERVPFLFSIKELVAKGNLGQFGGDFVVPSYRGSSFLDPKGRGESTGYDTAVALPAGGDTDELAKENQKSTKVLKGSIVFSTASVNNQTGEIAGVFESVQPSDTDLGAKAPKDIKITGLWYGQLS